MLLAWAGPVFPVSPRRSRGGASAIEWVVESFPYRCRDGGFFAPPWLRGEGPEGEPAIASV